MSPSSRRKASKVEQKNHRAEAGKKTQKADEAQRTTPIIDLRRSHFYRDFEFRRRSQQWIIRTMATIGPIYTIYLVEESLTGGFLASLVHDWLRRWVVGES